MALARKWLLIYLAGITPAIVAGFVLDDEVLFEWAALLYLALYGYSFFDLRPVEIADGRKGGAIAIAVLCVGAIPLQILFGLAWWFSGTG